MLLSTSSLGSTPYSANAGLEASPGSRGYATVGGTGDLSTFGAATILQGSAKTRLSSSPAARATRRLTPVVPHHDTALRCQTPNDVRVPTQQDTRQGDLLGGGPQRFLSYATGGNPKPIGPSVEEQVVILSIDFDRLRKDLEVQKADLGLHKSKVSVLREHFDELTTKVDHMFEETIQLIGQAFQAEREGRARDLESFQFEIMKARLGQQAQVEHSNFASPGPEVATVNITQSADISCMLAAWPRLEADLKAECIERNTRLAELHAQLQREVARIGRQIILIREHCEEALMHASFEFAEQASKVEVMVKQEQVERTRESVAVRATLESVWQNTVGSKVDNPSRNDSASQNLDGALLESSSDMDTEGMYTIHAMIQEVFGNLSRISGELVSERKHRHDELNAVRLHSERLQRKVDLLQTHVLSDRIDELSDNERAVHDEQLDLLGSVVESEIMERVDQRVAALVAAYAGKKATGLSEGRSQGTLAF